MAAPRSQDQYSCHHTLTEWRREGQREGCPRDPAPVVELADTPASGAGAHWAWEFESPLGHQIHSRINDLAVVDHNSQLAYNSGIS